MLFEQHLESLFTHLGAPPGPSLLLDKPEAGLLVEVPRRMEPFKGPQVDLLVPGAAPVSDPPAREIGTGLAEVTTGNLLHQTRELDFSGKVCLDFT